MSNTVAQIGGELDRLKDQFCGQDGTKNQVTYYIPGPVLENFWKSNSVTAVLGYYSISQNPAIITENFLRAFSLLVYIGKVQYLNDLVEPDLRDTAFPLQDYPSSWPKTPSYQKLFRKIAESQWIFFPVIFGQKDLFGQVFGHRHILPIHTIGTIKKGNTVQVDKIEVTSSCTDSREEVYSQVSTALQYWPMLSRTTLIRKTYDERAKGQYERERKIFNNLQSRRSRHIVGYYGSYKQRQHDGTITYNLILEYVDGGNLREFYQSMNPPQDLHDVVGIWRSFCGVLEGLHNLHHSVRGMDTQTIHQDIKPDNLLVSKTSSIHAYNIRLVITDFGYSYTKVVQTLQDQWGVDSHGSQTYASPECSHHAAYTRTGRTYITPKADIWSLGCVMSEAAVWMKFGLYGLREYRERRRAETNKLLEFNQAGHGECFHDGAQVLGAVQNTHDLLRNTDLSDTVTTQVLDIIESFMLVAQKDRQDAQTLREQVMKLLPATTSLDEPNNTSVTKISEQQPEFQTSSRTLDDAQHRSPARRPLAKFQPSPSPIYEMPVQDSPYKATGPTIIPSQPHSSNILIANRPRFFSSGMPTRSSSKATAVKHHSNPPRLESRQATQPPSVLTFAEASDWYENAKNPGRRVDPKIQTIISRLKSNVHGRDHIFFIENSDSMGEHVEQIKKSFRILAYLAEKFDPDGVELYFSSQPTKKHQGDTTKLLAKLGEQQWNQINFEDRIGTFMDQIIIPRLSLKRQKFRLTKPSQLTIFVMTDGRWGPNREGAAGIERPVKKLIDEMVKKDLRRTQVAFQFLRFGDDPDGMHYLSYLDHYGQQFKCDCVDTKPIDGNIFDMFIGSINPEIDKSDEKDLPDMSPSVLTPTQITTKNSTPEPQSRFILPRRPSDPEDDTILSPLTAPRLCMLEPGPNDDTLIDWSRVELLPQSKSSLPESTPESVVQPTTKKSTLPLAKLFLVLPSKLQIQILASLPLSDLLSLRLTSKSWHALITLNEVPIACHHLEHHIPAYAQKLYPIMDQSSPSLHYICGLWHRQRVSSKLSYLMSEWITRDVFLKETDSQQQAFTSEKERMGRRLTWLLFHIFHFFEVYRALHVEYIKHRGHGLQREPYTLNPIEVQVMAMYDDDTLLRIHEVFPLLLSSLRRRLRPPAFAGPLERSLRGYMREQPSDQVLAAILCVGGLRQVTRIWEVKGYNLRCSMVDKWYAGIGKDKDQGPSRLALGRTSMKLGRRSFSNEESAHSSKMNSSLSGITIDSSEELSLEDRLVFNTSMSAGMPMGALNSEQLESLLPDLPTLQQIWLRTAEALIIHRRIVKDSQGIKRNQQVMLELIREEREGDQEEERWDEKFTAEALDSSYHRPEAVTESPLKSGQTSIQSGYSSATEVLGLEFQHRETPEQKVSDQDVPRPGERKKSSLASFSRIDLWWYTLMRLLDRPPSKSKRVTFRCGCGDLRYLDVEELVPGGADELQEALRADAEAVRQHGPAQDSSPSNLPTSPPEVYLTPLGQRHDQAHDQVIQGSQSQGPSEQKTLNKSSLNRTLILPNRQKHLIVCINTKRGLVTPQHLDVSSVTNDQYLFENIKTAYSEVRREHEWNLAALFLGKFNIPSWFLKFLLITPPKHIQLPTWLANRFQKCTFFIPQKAEFVRFQLMPVRKEIYAGNLVKPEVPSYEEVAVKRTYEYRPVPLKVKIISIPFLHELLGPGEHLGLFWWNRFPKKLDGALLWDENADCLGWGIHITEGWNKPLVIVLTLLLMSLFAVFVIVYSVLTNDGSTGAGIGSFLMAFLTLYCWLRYEGWKTG